MFKPLFPKALAVSDRWARAGFNPFGQTSTQLMMVRQRNSLYSFESVQTLSGRLVALINNEAVCVKRPAEPKNLSGFH
ncbi:hypothetical protein [Pararobbsia alpina]|uniref:Uncharacterized protein n=1 Tax=Pararobbsia alpina TaxID=621374 RepID=A0A6S7BI00_9BURK|nr:hypothetical protein [Pararobbsia alpina]CAB3800674.1 hypothetical protein LMG28138_04891 [Pararobbsia alpina]